MHLQEGSSANVENAQRPSCFGWWGLASLLLLMLPGWILRAGYENSLWTDEMYSLEMALKPLSEMVDSTTFDAHPPAYYIILRGWLLLGQKIAGDAHQLLWARTLSVLCMVALTAIVWIGARRLFGPHPGTLIAILISINPMLQLLMRNLRNYSFVIPALTLCFLLLLWIWNRDDDQENRAPWWGAGLYGVSAIAALYLHLLSAIVLTLLGVAWLAIIAFRRGPTGTPLRFGMAVAQLIAAMAFIPWLMQLRYQLRYLSSTPTPWMTPPDLTNLGQVFAYWIPSGTAEHLVTPAWTSIGAIAIAVPVAAMIMALLLCKNRKGELGSPSPFSRSMVRGAWLGFWVGAGFIMTTWIVTTLGLAKIFHAARYPVLGVPMFLIAIGTVASLAGRWISRSDRLAAVIAWLAVLPLFFLSVTGTVMGHRIENGWGVVLQTHHAPPELLPRKGESIYLISAELAPYLYETLAPYNALPIERIAELPAHAEGVTIATLDLWDSIRPVRDRIALAMISNAAAGSAKRDLEISNAIRLTRLDGIDHARWKEVFREGIGMRHFIPVGAKVLALPENQLMSDGWSILEIGDNIRPFRWGANDRMHIIFEGPLPAGRYNLRVEGYRQPFPEQNASFRIGLADTNVILAEGILPAGHISISIPVELARSHTDPILFIECPTWIPRNYLVDNLDSRRLSFLFSLAWFEPEASKVVTEEEGP